MKMCPWCNNKAIIRNSPVGFFVECEKNGHIHNIGCFEGVKSFHEIEGEAINEWDENIKKFLDK